MTTSWVGAIGVRLASTRKVASADSSASATATTPNTRASRPGAAARGSGKFGGGGLADVSHLLRDH